MKLNNKGLSIFELLASVVLFSFFMVLLTRSITLFNSTIEISKYEVHVMNKGILYSNTILNNLRDIGVTRARKCGTDCVTLNNGEYDIEIADHVLTTDTFSSDGGVDVLSTSSIEISCFHSGSNCTNGVLEIVLVLSYNDINKEFKITSRIGSD